LKEIGVSLGHRRQLLRAIAELPNREKDAPKAAPAALASAAQDMAERRQVTVMFSDLVGSTALSARMDPEDLREVISAYQKCVTEIVQRFGGFVAKYMGDGVLVYFGYPQAHEDDAERAVRAGLQLAAALGDLKTHAALQTRVGIATGLVVVRTCRSGRGTRTSRSALDKGKGRRRPNGVALRRGRDWEIAAHGRAARTPRYGAAYPPALFLFAAAY
jgi:class 3 adenylate cyclase